LLDLGAKPHRIGKIAHPGFAGTHFITRAFASARHRVADAMTAAMATAIQKLMQATARITWRK